MERKNVKQEVLTILLKARGSYVSGAYIAKALELSRPTIHRIIGELRNLGHLIESHPRKGYRLITDGDLSLANYYLRFLPADIPLHYHIHYVSKCSSTQDIAEALAREGYDEGLVVIAEQMNHGRGRLGRKWVAEKGGLWLTIVLKPPFIRRLQLISLGAGVAVASALRELYGIRSFLKWPNDVLVDGKKLCGILVEGKLEADKIHYVLTGIGINVNNEIPNSLKSSATTLKELLGAEVPRLTLLAAILIKFAEVYKNIKAGNYREVVNRWRKLSSTLGKNVRVNMIGEVIEGEAVDINPDGSLLIKSGKLLKRVYAGDVIHLIRHD